MIIFCSGMPRSASTWSFNVCRLILEAIDRPLKAGYPGLGAAVDRYIQQNDSFSGDLLIKTHVPGDLSLNLIRARAAKNIFTLRDPRDSLCSRLSFEAEQFDAMTASIASCLELLDGYTADGNTLLIRFEQIQCHPIAPIRQIANYLECDLSLAQLEQICEETSLENSRKIVARIDHLPIDRVLRSKNRLVDRTTLFHTGHIVATKPGSWRKLSPEQQLIANLVFKPWLVKLNYESESALQQQFADWMLKSDWRQQADHCFDCKDYVKAEALYELAIEQFPDEKTAYWYLGLAVLLQGREADAQGIWFVAMATGSPEQIDRWTLELIDLLEQEANRAAIDIKTAWLVRQHIREIAPTQINNLLHLLRLELRLEQFDPETISRFQVIELLQKGISALEVDPVLLREVLQMLLVQARNQAFALEIVAAFAEASLPFADQPQVWIEILLAESIAAAQNNNALACRYAEMCLRLDPQHPTALLSLSQFYQFEGRHSESVGLAKRYSALCQSSSQQITANALLLKGLMRLGSAWEEAEGVQQQQTALLDSWFASTPLGSQPDVSLLTSPLFFAPYFHDRPQATRFLQNRAASRYQSAVDNEIANKATEPHRLHPLAPRSIHPRLRIGYLSRCLRRHSVGWLSRWIFQHFDRHRFDVYIYFHQPQTEAFSEQWFAAPATHADCVFGDPMTIANRIRADEIDILVELDSVTVPATCEVMALKSAPVQVTWLGWDATGLPAIDYFLADPYVLPDTAQDYYAERIWRLPQTYIAVDGFEVGIPTLRRSDLEVPADAIVYFSSQNAYKRHPDTVRAQLQILHQVPNSYFLVKGWGDEQGIQTFFQQMALEAGVSQSRLRFLPLTTDEATHRANLSIADIVLDTFPFNGATTTLETLWMEIPLVTQVGEQFASRNSYTMLMNVGVTEGIAWNREEYVAWGVRLGLDAALRQQVRWKLRQSRQTSPLWNAKEFTRDLEQAYLQMWQLHAAR